MRHKMLNQAKQASDSAGQPLAQAPWMSVIVPVHNGSHVLPHCLDGLLRSNCRDFEILVVDDCSIDDTPEIAERYRVGYVRTPHRMGPGGARNLGVERSKNDIVVFVDSDVVVAPDALLRIRNNFMESPDISAVFGSYDDTPAEQRFVSQYKNLSHHYYHQISSEEASTFWAGCGAVRKQVFVEVGGFDVPKYARPSIEDIDLGIRIKSAGGRIRLDKQVLAQHLKRWSLSGMINTDIFQRAIPWSRLILESKSMPNQLNLRYAERISGLLVGTLAVVLAMMPMGFGLWHGHGMLAPSYLLTGLAALILALLTLNWPMYDWLARRRGFVFATRAALLHWLYYFYSGLAFAGCMILHPLRRVTSANVPANGPPAPSSSDARSGRVLIPFSSVGNRNSSSADLQ